MLQPGARQGGLFAGPTNVTPAPNYIPATPKPPSTPAALLTALNDEILLRWGEPMRMTLARSLDRKETNALEKLLDKYSPEAVQAMTRLLVWDWEEAREQCWPKSPGAVPALKQLVDYAATLATVIPTGFRSSGQSRGRTGYAERYIAAIKPTPPTKSTDWYLSDRNQPKVDG